MLKSLPTTQIALPTLAVPPVPRPLAKMQTAYETDGATAIAARLALEARYADLLTPTDEFNRKLVSYQANKQARLHNWLKYKEGFSAQLVETLLDKFAVQPSQKVLEPFAGSATTLLVAQARGIDAVGIELLPACHLAWEVKSRYRQYDLAELRQALAWVKNTPPPTSSTRFPHVLITESAFPPEEEAHLMGYRAQIETQSFSTATKQLLQFTLMSILEDVSYTRKDGQYLRWDSRAPKAQDRDARRQEQGKPSYKTFHKGELLTVPAALIAALENIVRDVALMQQNDTPLGAAELIAGTVLEELPRLAENQFAAVITSPPYCNRYDYTRTYALELAFLGVGEERLRELRQTLLSCTVENRPKYEQLRAFYSDLGRAAHFEQVAAVIRDCTALQEVFAALRTRGQRGELNNQGVIRMVEGYFTELAFVIFELHRVCQPGARVAIVNDNVRYGGEMMPVDLLMTDLAAAFGFTPETIYVLAQQKGNSSQQMGKYGREANRKSITVWSKP